MCLSTVELDSDGTASPAVIQDNVDVGKETGSSAEAMFPVTCHSQLLMLPIYSHSRRLVISGKQWNIIIVIILTMFLLNNSRSRLGTF